MANIQKPTEPVRLNSASDLTSLVRGNILTINRLPHVVYRRATDEGGYVEVIRRENESRIKRFRISFKAFITVEDGGIFFRPDYYETSERGVSTNYEEEDRVLQEVGR